MRKEPAWEAYDPQTAWEWHDWAEKRIAELEAALKPFAKDDFCVQLGGNVQGINSPVFQRQSAILTIGDFRAARAALEKDDHDPAD